MAIRLRGHWHQKNQTKTIEEIASVIGFNCWKIASNAVLELENKNFHTETQADRLAIVAEFVAFLLQVTDRWAYAHFDDESTRPQLMSAVAQHVVRNYVTNKTDIFGENTAYTDEFIDFLNERGAAYAEINYVADAGGFALFSFFGRQVETAMHNQRWVSEYIVDIAGPEALEQVHKNLRTLFE